MSKKMDLEDNILFITGRLAENNLKKVIELLENKNFKYEVRNLGINVAALMTIDIIEKNIGDVEEFNKIIPITGIIMTKLDGTAKGGILLALAKKFKLPIIALGLGEKEDDLQMFKAEQFANAFVQSN